MPDASRHQPTDGKGCEGVIIEIPHSELTRLFSTVTAELAQGVHDLFSSMCFNVVDLPLPAELHPETAAFVRRFAVALAVKLRRAEIKYGYAAGWAGPGRGDELRAKLGAHMLKGDPLDVAIFAGFLWHHGERTQKAGEMPLPEWHAFIRGFAVCASLVCSLKGSLNPHEVFTENGITWENLKEAGCDNFDMKRIARELGRKGLLTIGRIPRAERHKSEGGAS